MKDYLIKIDKGENIMVTDSYSASCYIENNDGQYHMECDMQTDDREVYSEYDGDDFIVGLNTLMTDLQKQMLAEPEPEPKEMSLEEQVKYLQGLVDDLQKEKTDLINQVNNLTSYNNSYIKKDEKNLYNDNIKKYLKDIYKSIYGTDEGFSSWL